MILLISLTEDYTWTEMNFNKYKHCRNTMSVMVETAKNRFYHNASWQLKQAETQRDYVTLLVPYSIVNTIYLSHLIMIQNVEQISLLHFS